MNGHERKIGTDMVFNPFRLYPNIPPPVSHKASSVGCSEIWAQRGDPTDV
jgi:hypothetical protein